FVSRSDAGRLQRRVHMWKRCVPVVPYAARPFIIFFDCYDDPRDLHSFPTRRSSDLTRNRTTPADARQATIATRQPTVDQGSSVQDRKSTRLNSSHDQSSYAVFCLKKKTERHRVRIATVVRLGFSQWTRGPCNGRSAA